MHKLIIFPHFPFSRIQNICKHSDACQMQRRKTGLKTIDIESKWFSFFLKCFFVSRFQFELCDMNTNVTCHGSLLCREEPVCCNVGHLEYCMSLPAGLYWWFAAVPGHLLISQPCFVICRETWSQPKILSLFHCKEENLKQRYCVCLCASGRLLRHTICLMKFSYYYHVCCWCRNWCVD